MDDIYAIKDTIVREADTFSMPSFYTALHVLSDAALSWRRVGGERGWSGGVRTPTGEPVFVTAEEQAVVENFFDAAGAAGAQSGGAAAGAAAASPEGAIEFIKTLAQEHIDPRQISLDLAYRRATDYMDEMDRTTKDLARQVGILKFQNSMPPIPLQPFGIPYELSPRTIIPIVVGLVELLRVMASMTPLPLDFLRAPLSILAAVLDIGRGDWKKSLLSAMGILGRWPAALGIMLKVVRDVFLFVSPDLSTEMRELIFKSSKSFFAGVLFWSFSTFAPEPIYAIVEGVFAQASDIIRQINEKVDAAEETIISSIPEAMRRCYDIKFRRIPEGIIPEFDNMEALQTAFQVPAVYCNQDIRATIERLTMIPPVRLMLELLNIPTLPEDFAERCAGVAGAEGDIESAVVEALRPIVTLKAECTAGAAAEATKQPTSSAATPQPLQLPQ
jgi:hypothetical protein